MFCIPDNKGNIAHLFFGVQISYCFQNVVGVINLKVEILWRCIKIVGDYYFVPIIDMSLAGSQYIQSF